MEDLKVKIEKFIFNCSRIQKANTLNPRNFEDKLKTKNLFIGKKNTIIDCNDNVKGSFGVESIVV